MKHDDFGDRMKGFEAVETARRLDASLPVYARIDGRGFSKFTKGLKRPFDPAMSRAMIETTRHLVAQTKAKLGYCQSDEISLLWHLDGTNPAEEMFFNGKVQKLVSVLAAMATAAFTQNVLASEDEHFRSYVGKMPHFDARVFNLPSMEEGANAFLWREMDATRNAVSMTAHANFSHKQLQGVGVDGMLTMLADKGVEFDEYPVFFRRGTYLRRETYQRPFTEEERLRIPEAHLPDPDAIVVRSEVREIAMPAFVTVRNRVEVVFNGAEPDAG